MTGGRTVPVRPVPDESATALYARLVAAGSMLASEVPETELAPLLRAGLAVRRSGTVRARPPHAPLQSMAESYQRMASRAQELSSELTSVWNLAHGADLGIDIFTGDVAVHEFTELIASATTSVCALSYAPRAERPFEPAPGVFEILARGVEVRAVYDSRVFESAAAIQVAESCMAAGEQARVFPGVPISLVIVDSVATINVTDDQDDELHVAWIRNRRMVEALRSVFESYWGLSMPLLDNTLVVDGSEDLRDLVRLLSAGLTDRAIARELQISERTVGRRVTRLQELLAAETRFQLGLQISRHGWV